MFDHSCAELKISHPGIAKLVSRLVWDQETVRSSRTTRTNFKKFPISKLLIGNFLLFFVYCDAEFDSNYFFLDSFIFQLQLI